MQKMNKKAVSLISSGIDSPVAAYLMMKQGVDVVFVHMDPAPFSDGRNIEIVKQLLTHLSKIFDKKLKLYIAPHGENFTQIQKHCENRLTCILCKRMMIRVANKIAEKEGADYILTGENLGQVASQTLENMQVIDNSSERIVLRPLLTNDKTETIKIAREIGTYDISIQKCTCCKAVPQRPATKSTIIKLQREEERIDIKKLVEDSVNNSRIINIE